MRRASHVKTTSESYTKDLTQDEYIAKAIEKAKERRLEKQRRQKKAWVISSGETKPKKD